MNDDNPAGDVTCGHDRPGNGSTLAKCGAQPRKAVSAPRRSSRQPTFRPFRLAWGAGTEQGHLRKSLSGRSRFKPDISAEGLAALGQVISAWRQLGAVTRRSSEEVLGLFERLGVPAEDGRRAMTLIEQLRRVSVAEPGKVINVPSCGLGWQPSVLAPVFYGNREIPVAAGSPMRLSVFFPSTDKAPDTASPLMGCGRYPLVLFLHGSCSEADHFRRWDLFAARLARAGYVVAVPELVHTYPPWDDPGPQISLVEQLLIWMRSSWEFADILLPGPATAIVGHSYGALLGGRLAARQRHPFSGYASLSGVWEQWGFPTPNPLPLLGMASLFVWGDDDGGLDKYTDIGAWWSQLNFAKHRLVFSETAHWDYLGPQGSTCASLEGAYPRFVRDLAADFVLMFLSHYLPPERWWLLPITIPHSLVPPPLDLTSEQEAFAAGHLAGFARTGSGSCSVTHTWQVNADAELVTLSGH